jgi:hypothetical protein
VAALLLPPLILTAYALSGWLASGPAGQASPLSFRWEQRHVPLVPWMIVPYLSLHALLVCAFFLCRDVAELRRLVRGLLLATFVACACFVLWPMTMAFDRDTAPVGMLGEACRLLWRVDVPHNRLPSLHVAVAVQLWPLFARRARGAAVTRTPVHAWFGLVIASTLLTWQHHVADVAAGALLGAAVSMNCSRRRFSRSHSSSAPGPNNQSAAVQPNATPVHVPRWQ